jgi:hypothetical protein
MDAVTMVFRAQDPAMLKQVEPGDRIQFTADRVNGQLNVTAIKKGRPRRSAAGVAVMSAGRGER